MGYLLGEYECKVDPKGRFMLPAGLKKQLSESDQERFVINRGFETNLTLYPNSEWQKISQEINTLNLYSKKNRDFVRYFFRGASEIIPDSAHRLLLPKSLLDYAGIEKDIVLFAYGNRVEIWAKEAYEDMMGREPEDFSSLAEEVMGKLSRLPDNENLS
ncbi:MAG TPA: division/cell wall cluster transcriptional repressor MraZ [Bacteroidales bacterium]|nr:division/cell wall cluster transcriptional repressor MraZ [Bacteroidales bacterium]